MKDSLVFFLGALFSAPFSTYLSREWFFVLTILFIFGICICGGLFALVVKSYILDWKKKNHWTLKT